MGHEYDDKCSCTGCCNERLGRYYQQQGDAEQFAETQQAQRWPREYAAQCPSVECVQPDYSLWKGDAAQGFDTRLTLEKVQAAAEEAGKRGLRESPRLVGYDHDLDARVRRVEKLLTMRGGLTPAGKEFTLELIAELYDSHKARIK